MNNFKPEGYLISKPENKKYLASKAALDSARRHGLILESLAFMCDSHMNLHVRLDGFTGIIERDETVLETNRSSVRDISILSRVGKPVCFKVLSPGNECIPARLSRKAAQQECLNHLLDNLTPGDIIPARVTHLDTFGAFVDIGCGCVSLIGLDSISVSRIRHPNERFRVGQDIFAVVTAVDKPAARIHLSHRELLGTWEENANMFRTGTTVVGKVRGIEDFGVFIELTPNLTGLAERQVGLCIGDSVSVYVKAIQPDRMKIKLIVIDRLPQSTELIPLTYFITHGRIDRWRYSPSGCRKKIIDSNFADRYTTHSDCQ